MIRLAESRNHLHNQTTKKHMCKHILRIQVCETHHHLLLSLAKWLVIILLNIHFFVFYLPCVDSLSSPLLSSLLLSLSLSLSLTHTHTSNPFLLHTVTYLNDYKGFIPPPFFRKEERNKRIICKEAPSPYKRRRGEHLKGFDIFDENWVFWLNLLLLSTYSLSSSSTCMWCSCWCLYSSLACSGVHRSCDHV